MVNALEVALFMLMVVKGDVCTNHFNFNVLSVDKVAPNSIFKLPKAGLFGG